MDILDILLDILLKPPQPFIGLFFYIHILSASHSVANKTITLSHNFEFGAHQWPDSPPPTHSPPTPMEDILAPIHLLTFGQGRALF